MCCAGDGDSERGFAERVVGCDSEGSAGPEGTASPAPISLALASHVACSRLPFDGWLSVPEGCFAAGLGGYGGY